MQWYLKVLRQYADFGGRARRREYWMFTLFQVIAYIVLVVVDMSLGLTFSGGGSTSGGELYGTYTLGVLSSLYWLATVLPSFAVLVRRLHDTDRSGWWILIGLVPFVGGIVLLVFAVLEGTPGPNRYGPDPKAIGEAPGGAAPAYGG